MKFFDDICAYILIILLILACLILVFSSSPAIIYCGVAIIILLIFLSIDFYYRSATKQIYEELIKQLNDLISQLINLMK